jgi:UDP-2,4-diacetamido-2,4,6-trideoxy-beta-L-altropyranose hydrolase
MSNARGDHSSGSLLIRADASSEIGTGHILRCLALAQAWQTRGGVATFISYCQNRTLSNRIIDEGFNFVPVEKPHPDPSDLNAALDELSAKIDQPSPAGWLVLDGNHFDTPYQKAIKKAGYQLLVIDDMNHLPYYDTDILLNQNIHAERLRYPCNADTRLMLGTSYALLRDEFLSWRGWKREIPDVAHKLLVTLGGSDSKNVTLKVIQALNSMNDLDLEVRIVIGPSNLNTDSLKRELTSSPFAFDLLTSVKDMPGLMTWADMAISAGGSTCWEMAYMGLPNIIIVLDDNQESVAEGLEKEGCSISVGNQTRFESKTISKEIKRIIFEKEVRKVMSEKGQNLIDGLGAVRVLKELAYIHSKKLGDWL